MIAHSLSAHYAALQKIKNRKALFRSALWQEIGAEVERVTSAVEIGRAPPSTGNSLKALAWNIQRGRNFEKVFSVLARANADLVLLLECDHGMGRSGGRHVARELAERLGMSYAFAVSYLVLEDDFGENPDGKPNDLALAGTAILSKRPIARAENVDMPELRDKFSSSEKRLGHKRALLVELEDLPVAACHLDSTASPRGRARQLSAVLNALPHGRALVGGDFNSSTYDLGSPLALARDLLHKLFVTGFTGTIENYMTPERLYDQPLFEELFRRGFAIDGFNDRAHGTLRYDLHDPYAIQKAQKQVGRFLTWLLQRKLRPWNGVVPARLDWFAGRGLVGSAPEVLDGEGASDHSPITIKLI